MEHDANLTLVIIYRLIYGTLVVHTYSMLSWLPITSIYHYKCNSRKNGRQQKQALKKRSTACNFFYTEYFSYGLNRVEHIQEI